MKSNLVVLDVETTPEGKAVLWGSLYNGKYYGFLEAGDFWKFIKQKKLREVWCHNIEFDFFKLYEYLPELKFIAYFSSMGLSYIQVGNVFFKDLYNHLPFKLEKIGKLIGMEKGKIDYSKIKKVTQRLVAYNKRDCEITYYAILELRSIYKSLGLMKPRSTTGSMALELFKKKFMYGWGFEKIDYNALVLWRLGYYGGWVEAFEKGYRRGTFHKIDINSLYPFVMNTSYPVPHRYKIKTFLTEKERYTMYWLGVLKSGKVINNIEDKEEVADWYFLFEKKNYCFRAYIDYLKPIKDSGSQLKREVIKKLMNSLSGKFGQRFEVDVVSNYKFNYRKNIFYMEQMKDDLYRVKMTNKESKYWVNVVWSLFTTAKGRYYMKKLKEYLEKKKIKVYYIDTDCFIISGDIKKIKHLIHPTKFGLFKLEDTARVIDIRGRKFYRFGSKYKCKGVPANKRKQFFNTGVVKFKKLVRYREGLIKGVRIGKVITVKKTNKKNILPIDKK